MSVSAVSEEINHQGGVRPRALIVTIYGLYGRQTGGWLSAGSLIRLMAGLGVDEQAVRSSISRLKRRGILEAERLNGAAGYALSAHARAILDEGDRRIFDRYQATLDEGWVLAIFSVPESERQKRHMLRSRLSWLGFGTVGPGVWIAPGYLQDETRVVLERHDLGAYVDLFQARYLGFHDVRQEASTWWGLEGLDRLYREFHAAQAPVLAKWKRRRSPEDGSEAFADYVRALTMWRRLPFLDPGLAAELLPPDWMGARAADLFAALRERLDGPARRHVESVRSR